MVRLKGLSAVAIVAASVVACDGSAGRPGASVFGRARRGGGPEAGLLDCFVTAVHLRSGRVCWRRCAAAPFKKKRPLKHGFVSVGRQAAYPVQGMRAA